MSACSCWGLERPCDYCEELQASKDRADDLQRQIDGLTKRLDKLSGIVKQLSWGNRSIIWDIKGE